MTNKRKLKPKNNTRHGIKKAAKLGTLTVLASLALSVVGMNTVLAGSNDSDKSTLTSQSSAYNHEWAETPFGAFVSPVSGDLSQGKHMTLVRFPAGLKTAVHTHSHDYTGVVITGVAQHFEPGKKSTMNKLPAGSHWSISANTPHVSHCYAGSGECIMVISQEDNFDYLPQ